MSSLPALIYPANAAERDAWILKQRPARAILDPLVPWNYFVEEERTSAGTVESIATIFLTNRECPFRCLMCDLWRNTLPTTVPQGAIPSQIDFALAALPPARHLKLYNSGSFFDPRAIPITDYPHIAMRANQFDRLIVENHPALTGNDCLRFRDMLNAQFEVAMGLETANPEVLAGLNKRMTLSQFSRAADFLRRNAIDLRVFILVQPPLMAATEALHWAKVSLQFAMDQGAAAVTLIPTRANNGAMEALAATGRFVPPTLKTLEAAMEYGLQLHAGRVFADLWDLHATCTACHPQRMNRLQQMNLHQVLLPEIACDDCGGDS